VTVTGGCRFAMDDVVEDEKDERRLLVLWLDILKIWTCFRSKKESRTEIWTLLWFQSVTLKLFEWKERKKEERKRVSKSVSAINFVCLFMKELCFWGGEKGRFKMRENLGRWFRFR
jgi:hypothetical protein